MLRQEQIFEKAISFFTAMAVLISCLGLYGLSAYTTSQRRKEISIRKVLGANASSIVALLNKKFTLLVAIAALIASPVAAYAMTEWTSGFAYKTEIQVWLFIGAIGFAFMIALGTVSFHAIKAAFVNPAETLKHE